MKQLTKNREKGRFAVWALTHESFKKASIVVNSLKDADGFCPERMVGTDFSFNGFQHFKTSVGEVFHDYEGHIFIMAAGIVVRIIAPLLRDKVHDPAVVVLDEKAQYAISLLSGHLGGANALAQKIAQITGAAPVITTATDIHGIKAFDTIAAEKDLWIENPDSIKVLNTALLEKRKIHLMDPMKIISPFYENNAFIEDISPVKMASPAVYIGDRIITAYPGLLIMRPRSLVAGIGCNRGTGFVELRDGIKEVFQRSRLSMQSLRNLATIDLKKEEKGMIELRETLNLPMHYFSSKELCSVKGIENPSQMVKKHTGTEGVCEAAALLSAGAKRLLVPKQILKNMTLAVARVSFVS
jgi:cobalt-precorrin 5A hydrolase